MKESLTQCYRHLEQDKKHGYETRVIEVELGCFTPLVFSTSGGLGPAPKTFYKKLASLIAEKHNQPYSLTSFWLHAKLSFFVATFCNHVSSWLKVVIIPSRRMLPTDSAILICPAQQAGMLNVCIYLYALMFEMMLCIDYCAVLQKISW